MENNNSKECFGLTSNSGVEKKPKRSFFKTLKNIVFGNSDNHNTVVTQSVSDNGASAYSAGGNIIVSQSVGNGNTGTINQSAGIGTVIQSDGDITQLVGDDNNGAVTMSRNMVVVKDTNKKYTSSNLGDNCFLKKGKASISFSTSRNKGSKIIKIGNDTFKIEDGVMTMNGNVVSKDILKKYGYTIEKIESNNNGANNEELKSDTIKGKTLNLEVGNYKDKTFIDCDISGNNIKIGSIIGGSIKGDHNSINTATKTSIKGDHNSINTATKTSIKGDYNKINSGNNNTLVGDYNEINSGNNNTLVGDYNEINSGDNNTLVGGFNEINSGNNNTLN